jgi:CRISPR-associated protein Csx10
VKHLQLELTALSPLAIRSDHAPGGAATAKVIPGSALAGCLANVHRLLFGKRAEEFEELFLKGQVHYPHLYPAIFNDSAIQEAALPVYPVPRTAQTCKKRSGFLFPKNEKDDRHGVRDSLLDWAIFNLLTRDNHNDREHELAALKILHDHHECNKCKALIAPFTGYYRCYQGIHVKAEIDTRLQTRTGISREWGIVEEGILYSREVIEDGMRFWGTVKLPEELEPAFNQLLAEATISNTDTRQNSSLFRIGTGRTRGLGAVKIANRGEEQHDFAIFKERLAAFSSALIARAKEAHVPDVKPFYFALTLHSPMILQDEFLRYHGVIDAEKVAASIGLPTEEVELVYHAARLERITGWQELWGTPRFKEYAITIGSVFLFGLAHEPDEELWHKLFTLEEEGMGKRRADGFGRVMLSDPFHLQKEEVLR